MNEWLIAATVLLGGLAGCALVCALLDPVHGLVALELASVVTVSVLLLLAEGLHRQAFVDLALVYAVLSFPGALVFARLMERRL